MTEKDHQSLDDQSATYETGTTAPLVCEDFADFEENERASYVLIVSKTLSCSDEYPESSISKRLREAIMKHRNEPTYRTRNEIRDLVLVQFLGRAPQHKPSPPPLADSNAGVSMTKQPVKNVFETPELLEGILGNLSILDLIITSRVNKQFRNVAKTSPVLRSKLFLRSVEPTASIELSFCPSGSQPPVLSPRKYIMAKLNPLLRRNHKLLAQHSVTQRMSPGDHGHTIRFNERMLHAGCWTNMYLTNPPCIEARIHLAYTGHHSGVRVWISADRTICRGSGITLGMLMEAAHSEGPVTSTKLFPDFDVPLHCPFARATVTDQVRSYEALHQNCKMELDLMSTHIKVVGLALPSIEEVQNLEQGQNMMIRLRKGGNDVDVRLERGNNLGDIAQRVMRVDASWGSSLPSSAETL